MTVTAAKDDIDADGGVFHIQHPMTTDDAIFYNKATASRKDIDKVDPTLEEGVTEEWEKIDFSYLKQRFPRPVMRNPLQKDEEKLDFSIPGMPRGVNRGGKRVRSGPTRKQIGVSKR